MTLVNYECGMLKGRRPDYHPMDMLQFVYFRFGASHTLYIYISIKIIETSKRGYASTDAVDDECTMARRCPIARCWKC